MGYVAIGRSSTTAMRIPATLSAGIQANRDTRQHLINLLEQLNEHQRAKRMQQALDA